jgi:hypothetical protein
MLVGATAGDNILRVCRVRDGQAYCLVYIEAYEGRGWWIREGIVDTRGQSIFMRSCYHLQENKVSSLVFVYSSVPSNITKVYSLVPKLRKIFGTDET